ncbi:hypothetical protein NHX12_026037 [Muraenolepis orangiensis]|uniref:Thrombomodulin n=1 Tax=Muraenolepis orangiensis TaxID=630683 RepID=A0A9Q0EGT4_9TELE|nr:hypothetical protein NHX12_026037 [Muraenolepis orangiensis]
MFPVALLSLLLVAAAGGQEHDSGRCSGTRCYAVFSEPTDFQAARATCSELAGHLMTLRTPDSHVTLRQLLGQGGAAGPHWVGLYRPAGSCPGPGAPLRGFRWETGERDSRLYNWGAAPDLPGCERRCVSVSREDGFRWSAGPCDARAAGFLCEYRRREGCEPPGEPGLRYTRPPYAGQTGSRVTRLPHGTVATHPSDGAASMCLSGRWARAPWTCAMNAGGCEFECAEGAEERQLCLCPAGQAPSGESRVACTAEVSGDPCRRLGCAHTCAGDPPACTCRPGFVLAADGTSCRDTLPPPHLSLPACLPGYRATADRKSCVDVDECGSAPCEHRCHNTQGGFTCSCFKGYRPNPYKPIECNLYCGLAECPAECDPHVQDECRCPEGYISDSRDEGTVCVDIDECEMGYYCDKLCTNSFGGYVCGCPEGFSLVEGERCVLGTVAASTTVTYLRPPTGSPAPARLSAGGLVAVVVSVSLVVFLAVFLAHHCINRRNEARETRGEAHQLEGPADLNEKPLVVSQSVET